MAHGELRNLIVKTVKLFTMNNKKVSLADNGEEFLIVLKEKSVVFELTSHEIDLYCEETENICFELEIMVYEEIKTDSLQTNQIREFIKSLSAEINKVLAEKKAFDADKKRDERILKKINSERKRKISFNPNAWEVIYI